MELIAMKIAAIGAAGIAAQWLAWRLRLPAIVLLLAAGFAMGPATGLIDPVRDFGEIYKPAVGLAVAIILFEGGLTLNFREIRETSQTVRRVIFPGGLFVWIGAALAAHYAGGLSWPAAIILGAVLVVTGPTVIMPLLRSAKLKSRPGAVLRWEAIINDPIGALYAVVAFEVFLVWQGATSAGQIVIDILVAFAFAIGAGYGLGRALAWAFARGHVPDYLKAPILFATVITLFAVSNLLLEESGLLTVTIMGITLANSKIASLTEVRRFKETVTILLVSGLFILLTAALDWPTIQSLDWGAAAFVALLLFIVRPLAVFIATIGSPLSWQERLLIGWIAPRGIVAVAVIGLFGASLVSLGIEDGTKMIAFTFAVVVASIILHGFSLGPIARRLGLRSTEEPGLLIVGGSRWSTALAGKLHDMDVPVRISDPNWNHLSEARFASIPVHYGEILSEHAHHHLDLNRYGALLAATDNDAYNALVCTDFGPDIGRTNIFQIGDHSERTERQTLNFTLGGKQLFSPGLELHDLNRRIREGWTFQSTRLTDEFTHDNFVETRSVDTRVILWRKPGGRLVFAAAAADQKPQRNDVILSFAPPRPKKDAPAASTAKPVPALPDA
ncbi:MAG: sodium:proton antiporter [Roseitalea sp.]|nr:sodium:proton antiporter [Roseitalea sp.]